VLCLRFSVLGCGALWCLAGTLIAAALAAEPQDRESKVRADRANLTGDEHWIYNDLPAALAEARRQNKPLVVVLRCIPCEACSKFDDDVVRRDERIARLLDQFVCVRIVQANGLDLSLFDYDFDQSFAVVLMNADRVIYGRYGTRSEHRDESQDMTIEGFGAALHRALEWHAEYPANRQRFAGKAPGAPLAAVPEEFPSLRGKYTHELDYAGNVVRSCLHCHQVHEAQRRWYRDRREPIPDAVLYPFPSPRILGWHIDPATATTLASVTVDSPAEAAGFRPGDQLLEFDGQPLLSIADVQWVLHRAPQAGSLHARVQRDGQTLDLILTLDAAWRQRSNIAWRASTWDLRRMAFGGMVLEDLSDDDRRKLSLEPDALALRVKHVGQYGDHARAKQAGFRVGDVLVRCEPLAGRLSESELIAHLLRQYVGAAQVPVEVLRDGRSVRLSIPVQ
jgi:serine protease Do